MHPPGIACLAWKEYQTGDSAQMVYIASYVPYHWAISKNQIFYG